MVSSLQIITWLVDYAYLAAEIGVVHFFFPKFGVDKLEGSDWCVTMYLGILATSFIQTYITFLREHFFFWLLGNEVALAKRKYSLSFWDWYYVFQTNVVGTVFSYYGLVQGQYYFKPLTFSFETWKEIFIPFYIMQVLKDILSLQGFHRLMHESKWCYQFHKEHHTVTKNAQSLQAFHIDVLDLFLENSCAPIAFNAMQYLLGYPVRMNICAAVPGAVMDILIHSVNPHSAVLGNPVLDYIFACNVSHQIHHTVVTENYMFIPYHHLLPGERKREKQRYDEIMKTSFFSESDQKRA